jgi:hypothetical protein
LNASTELKLFLTVVLIYGFYVTMTDPFNNVDALCVGMLDHGAFQIDSRVTSDYAIVNGVKYSGYSPGASWLLVPLYALLRPVCVVAPRGFDFQLVTIFASWLLTIPLGALCVVALYRLLRDWQVREQAALLAAIGLAFGTMWFSYARRHNSYSLISAAMIFLSFILLKHAGTERSRAVPVAASGFLAFLAVAADYKNAISVVWLCFHVPLCLRAWQRCAMFGLGGIFPLTAMLAYNRVVFGHPLYTPAKFEVANNKLEESLQPGVIPLEGALHFDGGKFLNLLVGAHTGFFVYLPVAILALVGVAIYLRNKPASSGWALMVTSGIFLSNIILSASLSSYWHAGGDQTYYGPAVRYLLPAVPFVMIFAGFALHRLKQTITVPFVVLSVAINWLFVLSASYGWGASPIQPGWENLPLVVHARHIVETFGAESVWFNFLASSHFSLGAAGAAAITWLGAGCIGVLVWLIWRNPTSS